MSENWEALADAVKERRVQLRLPQDLSGYGGPGAMTVRKVEHCETTAIRAQTKTQLEVALHWPTGLVDRLLQGDTSEPNPPAGGWSALAEAAQRRRAQLGLRQNDLEYRGGPSGATVRNIEQCARATYSPKTLRQLEAALEWERGTAGEIVNGQPDPETATSRPVTRNDVRLYAIGASVRLARLEYGWSIELASEKACIAHVTWRRVEDGKPVRAGTYQTLDRFFGLAPGSFQRATTDDQHVVDLHHALNTMAYVGESPGEVTDRLARTHKVGAVHLGSATERADHAPAEDTHPEEHRDVAAGLFALADAVNRLAELLDVTAPYMNVPPPAATDEGVDTNRNERNR